MKKLPFKTGNRLFICLKIILTIAFIVIMMVVTVISQGESMIVQRIYQICCTAFYAAVYWGIEIEHNFYKSPPKQQQATTLKTSVN